MGRHCHMSQPYSRKNTLHTRAYARTHTTHTHACIMHACTHAHTHTRIHAHLTRASTSTNCRVEGYDARQAARCFGLLVLHTCTTQHAESDVPKYVPKPAIGGAQACGEAHTTRQKLSPQIHPTSWF